MIAPEILDAMVATGCTAEQIAAVVKAACAADEAVVEAKRKKDRERKRAERANSPAVSESVQGNPRTELESTENTETVSLSPVPLLSPIPPNNPLTPKPIQKTNSRGTRLPDGWTLCEADLAYALSKNLSEPEARELFERFCSWAWSAGGSNAVKRNWHQAWQGWVQREAPKIIRERRSTGPPIKPLTAFQRRRQETQDILDELDNFARGGSGSGKADIALLRHDPGERPEGVRGGSGADVVDLSAGGGRARG